MTVQPSPSGADGGRHIVLLASSAPSLINFRGPLLKALIGRGLRVTAVAPHIDDRTRDSLIALGVEPVEIEMQRVGMNPIADISYFRRLDLLFERLAPDALVAYTAKPVIWGSLAARGRSKTVRIVAMITGLGYAFTPPERPGLRHAVAHLAARLLYWRALRGVDHILFQNPDDQALFRRQGLLPPAKATSVMAGSGVDLEHYAPAPSPGGLAFLMISRLLGAKGVREYAAAALGLKTRYPHVSFRLVGGFDAGPDAVPQEDVERWVAGGLEYGGNVQDVRPAIAAANCIVLPSYREGTPRAVLEAMAMGRPIITTDAPGCRETVVEGVNGWLVPPRAIPPLADAMERAILAPDVLRRMGEASLDFARRKYDVHLANAVVIAALELDATPSNP